METKNIQEFLALAELGSSYAAAEKLFVSQSSLVRHIQAIEEEFGAQLFDRTRRGFVLNANGRIFLPYAERIAMAQDQCFKALHPEDDEESHTIRLAAEGKIIDLIIDFKKTFPQYVVDCRKIYNMEEQLRKGMIDIAFLSTMTSYQEGLIAVPFWREEVLVLLYEDHPLACRGSIRLEELRDEEIIALCDELVSEDAFVEMFKKVGFSQKISATVPVPADLTRMVSEGLGVALLHGRAETTPEYPGLKVLPLDPRMEYEVRMCYRNDVKLSKAASEFVMYAKKWSILHKDLNLTML